MTQNSGSNVNNLGEAVGTIKIDVSQLATAGEVIKQFAKTAMADLAPLNAAFSNIAKITSDAAKVQISASQQSAAEAKAAAEIEVAAIDATAQASKDATALQIQLSKERIAQMKREADDAEASGNRVGKAQQGATRPTGLARGIFSLGFAAQGLGIEGAAQPLFAAAGLAQIQEEAAVFGNQVTLLANRLQGMSGIFGSLAEAGASAAVALGASSGGVAAALGSLAAVAAPIIGLVAIVGGLVAALESLNSTFQESVTKANEYIDKQQQINTLIFGGATSKDLGDQAKTSQDTFASASQQLAAFAPFMDRIKGLSQNERGAVAVGAEGGIAGSLALVEQKLSPAIQQLNKDISDFTNGGITSASAMIVEYQRLLGIQQEATQSTQQLAGSTGNLQLQLNDFNASAKNVVQTTVEWKRYTDQLTGASKQQLQQMLAQNQTEADAIMQQGALVTGEQLDIFIARMDQLDKEKAAIQAAVAAADVKVLSDFAAKFREMFQALGLQMDRTQQDRAISDTNKLFDNITQQARSAEDYTRQRANEVADFNKQQLRSQQAYDDNREKENQKYNEDVQQQEQDHQDKMLRIMQDARDAILKAAAHLDAEAVYEAQKKRNEQLADEGTSYAKDKAQRAKAHQEQLQDQAAQFELQKKQQIADFQERMGREAQQRALQLQRQDEDARLADQRQRAAYALQDARRQQDFNNQVYQLIQHNNVISSLVATGLRQVQSLFAQFSRQPLGGLQSTFTNPVGNIGQGLGFGSAGGNSPYGTTNLGTGTPFLNAGTAFHDYPGAARAGTPYRIGIPEIFIPRSNGMIIPLGGAKGGLNVNWSGNIVLGDIGSRSNSDVIQLIDAGLRQFFNSSLAKMGTG